MEQKTLAIIKPDAVRKKVIGDIIKRIQMADFNIRGMKMIHITEQMAREFYAVHKEKEFFEPLVKFMSSGPSIVIVIEGKDVINRWRTIMGATNSPSAAPGTIRKEFGTNNRENCVHGSDSEETANYEISFFFKQNELV